MEEKPTLMARLRYFVDNLYSRGTGATVITLGLMALILALVCTALLITMGLAPGDEEPYTTLEAFWVGMLSVIGSGSIGGRESTWGYRMLMLGMTFGSILVGSFFISALTNGMVSRVSELKKGRSRIIEKNHVVILGWSEQIITIVSELMYANANQSKFCIAILGPLPKDEMEDQLDQKVKKVGNTRVVCRTGDPMEMADLKIVSLNTARTIIILSPKSAYPDADVIKTVLAIVNHPERHNAPYHIIAALQNPRNQEIARVVGRDEVQWVVSTDIVARMIAQTSLQPGLSTVYDDLFDFANNEIYLKEEPRLTGRTFSEALYASETNSVIGVCVAGGQVMLNPTSDYIIQSGDRLIVIASDDDAIHFQPGQEILIDESVITPDQENGNNPRKILILGWNWRGASIVKELDYYVPDGSEVTVIADHEKVEDNVEHECTDLKSIRICYFHGDTDDRQILEGILVNHYDHIILLGYSDKLSIQRADAKTLVTLLLLRDIKNADNLPYTIVTEMMDIRNYHLATTARADDYIISDRLISLLLAQLAESKELKKVFDELLNQELSEIYLKPANHYVREGQPTNFYTIVEAARRRSEVAIGYRLLEEVNNTYKPFGVYINPQKSKQVTFQPGDQVIVLGDHW